MHIIQPIVRQPTLFDAFRYKKLWPIRLGVLSVVCYWGRAAVGVCGASPGMITHRLHFHTAQTRWENHQNFNEVLHLRIRTPPHLHFCKLLALLHPQRITWGSEKKAFINGGWTIWLLKMKWPLQHRKKDACLGNFKTPVLHYCCILFILFIIETLLSRQTSFKLGHII